MDKGWFESAGGVMLPVQGLLLGGVFSLQHIRDGEVIEEDEIHNLVTDEGLNHMLNVQFGGATQVTTWYIGLFEGNYTPVASVTGATITAASTECIAYDEATRVAYVEAAAASKSITNSASKATFTMNATKSVYGAFLASTSAKSAVTGTLFSAARFAAAKSVVAADQLLLTYTFTAASA